MKATDKLVRSLAKMSETHRLTILRQQVGKLNFTMLHKKVKEQMKIADDAKDYKQYNKLSDLSDLTCILDMWHRWPQGTMEIEWEDGVKWN